MPAAPLHLSKRYLGGLLLKIVQWFAILHALARHVLDGAREDFWYPNSYWLA